MKILQNTRGLGFAACALAGALWGCSFLAGKIALVETDFAHMILYRFLFASLALAFRTGSRREICASAASD